MNAGSITPPAVSVLLPVHNAETYLRESLESILAQSFREFEVIAIDDGSTDGSLAILKEYAARDRRIWIYSRERRGLVATLNEGIELAQGRWIARMDADDVALPERFAKQIEQLERTQADFCGGAVECFGGWRTIWRYPIGHEACEVRLLFDVPFAHPTVIGRAVVFKSLRYSDDFQQAQDYDLWQRAWAAGYQFTNIPEIVLRYRVHGQQVSAQHQERQREGADRVRRRHWQALLPRMDSAEIERIIAAMGSGYGETAWMMPAFRQLLGRYSGEAQEALLSSCFRVFCRLAGRDAKAVLNWITLFPATRRGALRRRALGRAAVLLLLSFFHITPNSGLFQRLRRVSRALPSVARVVATK